MDPPTPRGAVATDTEDSNLNNKDIMMPPLIYPEESDNEEHLRKSTSAETIPKPGPPNEKPTKEPTSETDFDALSEPSTPTGKDSMGHLAPRDIVRYQKWSDPSRFATPEEHTKESPWGDTWKTRILGQDKSLEVGEDALTLTNSPSQIPTNLEEVDKYAI